MISYDPGNREWLSTHKQRPIQLSAFVKNTLNLNPKDFHDPALLEKFKKEIDAWINKHVMVKYHGLENFPVHDIILGTTHALDDLHWQHKGRIVVYEKEYRYHTRLDSVKKISSYTELEEGDQLIISYPSCVTTDYRKDFFYFLKQDKIKCDVHIDGAWFGCCRNFEFDVSHPFIKSVFVSLSKAFGMGGNRIGLRYTRQRQNGFVTIMNEHGYVNRADCLIGLNRMREFGADYLWKNYSTEYTKVCKDWNLKESNAFHIAIDSDNKFVGIRTPLRYLIDNMFDEHGTDAGLNYFEKKEKERFPTADERWPRQGKVI